VKYWIRATVSSVAKRWTEKNPLKLIGFHPRSCQSNLMLSYNKLESRDGSVGIALG
jgi:hypothetical protein